MIIHPEIDPNIFVIGPFKLWFDKPMSFPVRWYGVMYLVGFAIAWMLGRYRAKKPGSGWNDDKIGDLIFYCALGLIVGARVGYVLFYQTEKFFTGLFTWSDPWLIFKVTQGGMSFHGGLIGVICGLLYFCHRHKESFINAADFTVPLAPLGIFCGRMGNFINGELWGRTTDVPWCMVFRDLKAQTVDTMRESCIQACDKMNDAVIATKQYCAVLDKPLLLPGPSDTPIETCMAACRHPSQLYEGIMEGVVLFFVIWWFSSKPRPPLAVSGAFLLGYGIFRFSIEFLREPDAHLGFIFLNWVTMGQTLSAPMIIAGSVLLWIAYHRQWDTGKTS